MLGKRRGLPYLKTSILPRPGQIKGMGVGFGADQWKMTIYTKKKQRLCEIHIYRFLCNHNKEPQMITHNKSEAVTD